MSSGLTGPFPGVGRDRLISPRKLYVPVAWVMEPVKEKLLREWNCEMEEL